jgi:hypothetical protein
MADGSLSIIGAAVSPVVMISANAILSSGINARHSNVADRLRNLLEEYREEHTTERRRESIQQQLPLFQRRIAHIERANIFLFCATASFVVTVMIIALGFYWKLAAQLALPFFLLGVLLMLAGILAEVIELRTARSTLRMEVLSTLDTTSHRT